MRAGETTAVECIAASGQPVAVQPLVALLAWTILWFGVATSTFRWE